MEWSGCDVGFGRATGVLAHVAAKACVGDSRLRHRHLFMDLVFCLFFSDVMYLMCVFQRFAVF